MRKERLSETIARLWARADGFNCVMEDQGRFAVAEVNGNLTPVFIISDATVIGDESVIEVESLLDGGRSSLRTCEVHKFVSETEARKLAAETAAKEQSES